MNCGKELERKLATPPVARRWEGRLISSRGTSLALREAPGPRKMAQGSSAGKVPGPASALACTEWPGGGELAGTQSGHTEGPARAQKGEPVPEEQPPLAFSAANSL